MKLPEMSVIDTHLPSNTKIRGFTAEQMLAWGKANAEAERDKLQSAAEWCRMCERKGVFHEKATGDEANSPKVLGEG